MSENNEIVSVPLDIGNLQVFNRVLSLKEIELLRWMMWEQFTPWYARLWYWTKMTWLILVGRQE